ncbi:MAG: prolyl aminopeptidase [Alphaproteobacteria bacterium]|jgi:proline iminopeptidase
MEIPRTVELHPPIEPHETGRLDVGDGHDLYFEVSGNPRGRPVLFLHGGPGSGCKPEHRRFFDPRRWRIVLFDQRGAGRSTPSGSLVANTTRHLVADIEALRRRLGIARWVVFGGSWGSTLGLAYAAAHPGSCAGLVLRGIWLARRRDIDWWMRGVRRIFPEYWEEFVGHLPPGDRDDPVAGYGRRLADPDPAIHMPAAIAWRGFDQKLSSLRPVEGDVAPPGPQTLAVARIEQHYVRHEAFLEEGELLRGVDRFRHVPGIILHGRYDMIAPIDGAVALARAWPEARFTIVEDGSHSTAEPAMRAALLAAVDGLADLD